MGKIHHTEIEWALNPDGTKGYAWNPITGCLNQDHGICRGGGFPCYAYKIAHGRVKNLYLRNHHVGPGISDLDDFEDPFYPRLWEEHQPALNGRKPKGIFVCDMADLFGWGIPEDWTRRILQTCANYPQHRFYVLTKQPQNLLRFNPFPDNVWVGVTVCNPEMLIDAFQYLSKVKAKVKFISFEPLLERMNGGECVDSYRLDGLNEAGVNWVIIGAQTKPMKHPEIQWLQEVVEAADSAGAKVFLKNNLKDFLVDKSMSEVLENEYIYFLTAEDWEEGNHLRQEVPEA